MQVRTARAAPNAHVWDANQAVTGDPFNDSADPPSNMIRPTVYTVREVARILRLGKISVYQAIEKGEIPCIRIGRRILIPRHALECLLEDIHPFPKPAA
jgi:excisionase family DNA binding protein